MTQNDIIEHLTQETETIKLHSSVNQYINNFLKYLKEPRYQNPLSIEELSALFQGFYKDLNALIILTYTQSNSTKKLLISNCQYLRNNPLKYDYLLAISNYSSSTIKLVRRTDNEALLQLRIFNFYKLLVVLKTIELSLIKVFESMNDDDSDMLFQKIFRFNEKDLALQELFSKKVAVLRDFDIPFKNFLGSNVNYEVINEFMNNDKQLEELIDDFNQINHSMLPGVKLQRIVKFQRDLIGKLSTFLHTNEINNDTLLPILIYLIINKVDKSCDVVLNFNFIRNFNNAIDPQDIYLSVNTYYNPHDIKLKTYKKKSLFDCLNLDTEEYIETDEFFKTNQELINYANAEYFNNSEYNYYLTNFEAVIFYIQSVVITELIDIDTDEDILITPLPTLVEKQLFKFPPEEVSNTRSRSSSLFNTLTSRISEATKSRSRSNSNLKPKESFPTIDSETLTSATSPIYQDTPDNFSMMKNIINRFGSVSVPQFRPIDGDEEQGLQSSKHNRSVSLVESMTSANNLQRLRSPTLDNLLTSQVSPNKRNSIASKLSSGVSEIMTKFNNPAPNNHSGSTTSLKSLEDNDAATIVSKRPDYSRGRTSSIQVMEKWFGNLSTNTQKANVKRDPSDSISDSHDGSVFSAPSKELTKYHNVEFDELTISDLRLLKTYYDQLCNDFGMKFESKSTDLADQGSI